MSRVAFLLLLLLLAGVLAGVPVGMRASAAEEDIAARDEPTRVAVAVLGRVCLLGLGDPGATAQIVQPGGQFGFEAVPEEVADSFLGKRRGVVRVLRRPLTGTVVVVIGYDGVCSVWAQWGDGAIAGRHLAAMVERGGLKGAGQLVPLGPHDREADRVWNWYLLPAGWYAQDLARRGSADGTAQVLISIAGSPPGARPMELVMSATRGSAGR